MKDRIVQNLKIIKIMKATGYTDKEIADYVSVSIKDFLAIIDGDVYLKEVYEKAQEKLATDIEKKFLENVMDQLDMGDNTDAKWLLERTNKKYNKKDQLEVNIKSIDDIIRGE
jgi:orotate phosphoribosyltransferase-like protein